MVKGQAKTENLLSSKTAIADRSRQKIEINLSLQDTSKIHNLAEQLGISVSVMVQEVMHKYWGDDLI